jgi:hypothetical protein
VIDQRTLENVEGVVGQVRDDVDDEVGVRSRAVML